MSDQIEVRLLYPNHGRDRGEAIALDADEAALWCRRGLAEAVDPEALAGYVTAKATEAERAAAAREAVLKRVLAAPPEPEIEYVPIPSATPRVPPPDPRIPILPGPSEP